MDPKMDTGLIQDSSLLLDPAYVYTPEDLCRIMDELTALEVSH